MKIIYIAGYGRSGSTLLERLLASSDDIFGAGEIAHFLRDPEFYEICSCEKTISKCNIWGKIISDFYQKFDSSQVSHTLSSLESLAHPLKTFLGNTNSLWDDYKQINSYLFSSLFDLQNVSEFIIDSSKTARETYFRPFLLSNIEGFDVYMIHLTRHPLGVTNSYLKGSNRKKEKGLEPNIPLAGFRGPVGWLGANLAAQFNYLKMGVRNRYLHVKYEDFVSEPENSLAEVETLLQKELSEQRKILRTDKFIPRGHQIAGNRIRKEEHLKLKPNIKSRENIRPQHKAIVGLLDMWLAYYYGYKKF